MPEKSNLKAISDGLDCRNRTPRCKEKIMGVPTSGQVT